MLLRWYRITPAIRVSPFPSKVKGKMLEWQYSVDYMQSTNLLRIVHLRHHHRALHHSHYRNRYWNHCLVPTLPVSCEIPVLLTAPFVENRTKSAAVPNEELVQNLKLA